MAVNLCQSRDLGKYGYKATREFKIIYACGSKAECRLYEEIKEQFEHVFLIGDAASPRQALETVREAYEAAAGMEAIE